MSNETSTTENKQPLTGWRKTLHESAELKERAGKADKRATTLLWDGAQDAVNEWVPNSATDVSGETLYGDVMAALGGKARKGDASKIRTVAIAVKDHGLVLPVYKSLNGAYQEAKRLTKTVQADAAEDSALDKAVASVAASAPKSAGTPESAAKIVLAQGPAKAAALLLDALGATAHDAHRAFIRAVAQEAASRVVPKVKAVKAGPKSGAKQAPKAGTGSKKVTATKAAASKGAPAKGAPAKAAAKPVQAVKPAAAKPVQVAKPVAVKPPVAVAQPVAANA